MKHVNIKAFSIPDAWWQCINKIWNEGDIEYIEYGSEESEMRKLSVCVEITNPSYRPLVDDKAPNDMSYCMDYAMRYLWGDLRKPDEHYTYGSRLRTPVDQIKIIMNRIITQPKTRQLTLVIRRPEDIMTKAPLIDGKQILDLEGKPAKWEPPCFTVLDFEVKDNIINTYGYFRSWDCYGGFPINVAGVQLFLEAMCTQIKYDSKQRFSVGKQIWACKNLHLYKRQFMMIEKFLEKKTSNLRMKKDE